MKVMIGIQARTNSTRLPKKIYETIGFKSILEWVYDSCKEANDNLPKGIEAKPIVIAPSGDLELLKFCGEKKLEIFTPPPEVAENDLLKRYFHAMNSGDYTHLIRVTSDCWMIDPGLIMQMCQSLKTNDYASNTVLRSFPEGQDLQGCSKKALEWFVEQANNEVVEHPFKLFDENNQIREQFIKDGMRINLICDDRNPIFLKTSIDTSKDLERARQLYDEKQKTRSNLESAERGLLGAETHEPQLQKVESVR